MVESHYKSFLLINELRKSHLMTLVLYKKHFIDVIYIQATDK
ncbi:hypothetical protein VCRA2122O339_40155 [Vibrio crassostreae]|nr:hypothetical protein VCRA2120E331_50036 [Vibrio crassostreae]CAK3570764.1 hypothetical protein VCRA2120E330_50037 [Vibrio crassostreae]CAK3577263.1 hypothetical protein VCRA2127O345_50155 [Vibrio crassostreae]CAK3584027.1 hypothetical protein VCRA2122O339_40155 [Vibrio crassostreae]CAK3599474.1 hypothetical protein VCRA2122O338_50036 [Vibrio crassostreae]